MNKKNLVSEISKKTRISQKEVDAVLTAFYEIVGDTLSRQEAISLAGFGTFEVRERVARVVRNPRTGEIIEIPAHNVPSFKAGKRLKERVTSTR